ncbi:MAG: FadR family transcriptional regulator [Lentisphaerae bacterium]|nr:FadR family transcriptional regulator [Lentisphaerota bacterium]
MIRIDSSNSGPADNARPVVLRKVSAADAVVAHLKDRIRGGEFAPGRPLPSERELLGQIGVSRLTLREGLARLTALGIIRVRHGKGAFVADTVKSSALGDVLLPFCSQGDAGRMQDLVEARGLIEGELAARAAVRRGKADLDRLAELLVLTPEELEDTATFASRDLAFHREVARIAGNAFLTLMHEAICGHVEAFLVRYGRSRRARAAAMERHRPILDAIAAGAVEQARETARTHTLACLSAVQSARKQKARS